MQCMVPHYRLQELYRKLAIGPVHINHKELNHKPMRQLNLIFDLHEIILVYAALYIQKILIFESFFYLKQN